MNIVPITRRREQGSTLLAYLFVALAVMATITAIATYVVQNMSYSQRRQDMVNAFQFAQSGAAMACLDVQQAFTNTAGSFAANLGTLLYSKNTSLSSSTELVYERSISSPFTNQTVLAQLRMTNSSAPNSAKIFATATVGKVTQTAQVNVEMGFGYGAAILSTHQGTVTSGVSKSTAQDGNVVVDGGSKGTTKIDGGILANGSANTNTCLVDDVQEQLYGTAGEVPDYTSPGSQYQLFDFNRFMMVADLTGQHYTNLTEFIAKAKTATLEGVVAVNIKYGEGQSLDAKDFPTGINIRGTLIFNFIPNSKGQNWDPLDKIVNTATMNINAADLSGLVATDPSTYTSGYPPTYTDPTKKPSYPNINAASFGLYENFTDDDDLPALMYNNAILDMHGNVNICGAVYSSSFMEIENKKSDQIQYFRGALIGGGGIFVDNGSGAISIVSYDPAALGNLATAGGRGKTVKAVYRK